MNGKNNHAFPEDPAEIAFRHATAFRQLPHSQWPGVIPIHANQRRHWFVQGGARTVWEQAVFHI